MLIVYAFVNFCTRANEIFLIKYAETKTQVKNDED